MTNKTHRTERRVSIQETMNRMAGRMDSLIASHARDNPTENTPHELRFWIAVDPLLSDLHKRLLDSRSQRARIVATHGRNSALAETAQALIDSNQCAVETRLLELRRNEEAKAMVLALARKAMEEREHEETEAVHEYVNEFWKDFAVPQAPAAVKKNVENSSTVMLIAMLAFQQSLTQMGRMLSIARSFERAAVNDDQTMQPIAGSG